MSELKALCLKTLPRPSLDFNSVVTIYAVRLTPLVSLRFDAVTLVDIFPSSKYELPLVLVISRNYFMIIVKCYGEPSPSSLQAVPFWLVERVPSQGSKTETRRNKREETGERPFSRLSPSPPPLVCSSFFALGYFARPLDYPERD